MPLNDDERAELVAYLDGELDEQATQAVEARIATDPDTRAELDTLKQTWGMLDYLPKADPSPNFTHRTMEKLTLEHVGGITASGRLASSAPPRPSTAWTVMGWAASILIAVGLGYWGARRTSFRRRQPTSSRSRTSRSVRFSPPAHHRKMGAIT